MENRESGPFSGRTVRAGTFLFFGLLLLSGLLSYRDMGISWDEKTQYVIGQETYRTVFSGAPVSQNEGRRFHGPTFEFLLYGLQQMLPLSTTQQVFAMRHLMGFLLFFLGVIVFFVLARHHWKNSLLALLGAMMLALSPRIYGHAFFNSRDVPTLVLFVAAMFTLVLFIEKRTVGRALLHAGVCALLLSLRMVGIFLPAFTLMFLLLTTTRARVARDLLLFCGYCVACIVFTIGLWPLLWTDPLHNFWDAYRNMSSKVAGGFYLGRRWGAVPWHWIPVWIAVSTPLVYTALFLTGCAAVLYAAFRAPLHFVREQWRTLLFVLWFFLPILAVIVSHAGIFDEWRHVYFVYPAFLLLAVEGSNLLWQMFSRGRFRRFLQGGFAAVLAGNFLLTGFWMVRSHPLQYVYFSLPPPLIGRSFELDYWGLGFRQGVEQILAMDQSPLLPVAFTSSPGYSVINVLTPEQRSRIVFGAGESAKYIFDNFRAKDYRIVYPARDKVWSTSVGGREVLAVYRNPYWKPETAQKLLRFPTDGMVFTFDAQFLDPQASGQTVLVRDQNGMVVYFPI